MFLPYKTLSDECITLDAFDLACVRLSWLYIWVLKKAFVNDYVVLDRSVEKWRMTKSYELQYAMYAGIYVYVTLLYVIYDMMCNGFVLGLQIID